MVVFNKMVVAGLTETRMMGIIRPECAETTGIRPENGRWLSPVDETRPALGI
jgi:hypothetical protein